MIYYKASAFPPGLSQLMLRETQFSAIKSLISEMLTFEGKNIDKIYEKQSFDNGSNNRYPRSRMLLGKVFVLEI